MTDQTRLCSRTWWSYLRFSVRALIILVLLAGVWLGWLVRSAHTQREAVAAIQRAGGYFEYQWGFRDGVLVRNERPWWPKWFVDRMGVDYFGNVVAVNLDGCGNDEHLAWVGNLTRLEDLHLKGSKVTDAGLVCLTRLTRHQISGPLGYPRHRRQLGAPGKADRARAAPPRLDRV